MSVELREIKQRIGSTRQIRRVTGTLQRVAAARLGGHRKAVEASERYLDVLRGFVSGAGGEVDRYEHPLTTKRTTGQPCLVVLGADRGLCGGFIVSIVETAQTYLRAASADTTVHVVGKIVARRLQRSGFPVEHVHTPPARGEESEWIRTLSESLRRDFLDGTVSRIDLLYSQFINTLRQEPQVVPLLPVALSGDKARTQRFAGFEPAPGKILDSLLPELVTQTLYHAFVHSATSEDAARQAAMSRATENASDMLGNLMKRYSRLRQENITTEMLELLGGSTA